MATTESLQTAVHESQGMSDPTGAARAHTILVVEDSKVEQQRMVAMLQGLGYRVLTADDGAQALEILRLKPVRLILSDWRMPEMSGIDLCRAVRADPALGQPYLILVTGQNTKSDLIAGMDAGADDFIVKPFNGEELRVRVQAGGRLLELRGEAEQRSHELAAALQREAAANRRIRDDLALAARMQRASLPNATSPFPQLALGTLFHAAVEVAGDAYDFFGLDDRHLGFYLIDVAGHGVAAAMLSFTVSRFLSPETSGIALRHARNNAIAHPDSSLPGHIVPPNRVVEALNERFVDKAGDGNYFTMIYGVLDVQSGRGELCQAGHPHPLLVGGQSGVRRIGNGGYPVGMLAQASYDNIAFQIGRGERLILYSDGVTDCLGSSAERFGESRLANHLRRLHARPMQAVIVALDDALQAWHGDSARADDVSLLAIERVDESRGEDG